MKILDADSMREVDRAAIEEVGVPSLVLMENAAIGVVDAIGESYPEATSVGILCGPGNNGGDGLAVARHLTIRGYRVDVRLVRTGRGLSEDAQTQLDICRNQGVAVAEFESEHSISQILGRLEEHDLVVDALFGTGLKRPLEGFFADLVEAINSLSVPCVAVDMPSGLDGGSAQITGAHVLADLTVTFGAPKIPHVLHPACEAAGQVVVADLGIPTELIEEAPGNLYLLSAADLAGQLIARPAASHKGDYGHCLIVAGSVGKAGAAILTARAAVRVGSGLVTVAAPMPIVQTVDLGSVESMTTPLAVEEGGGLAVDGARVVIELLADKSVLAMGPGLGLHSGTVEVVRRLVAESPIPMVLDADAVNAYAGEVEALAGSRSPRVLTPHPGELARLLGVAAAEIQSDRVASVREAADRAQAIVVLKGHQTLIGRPDGRVMVNPTGNPGMATGGAGDVLTGMITGLISQGYDVFVAACLGVFLHGMAGDLVIEETGESGLAASDLVERIPAAMLRLER